MYLVWEEEMGTKRQDTKRMIRRKELKKKLLYFVLMGINAILLAPMDTAYATDAASNQAVNGIHTLIKLACNIVSAIGGFVTLWGIFEMGNAMQQHDAAQQGQAGKRLAGGIVMIAATQLLKLFFTMS